MKLKGSTLIEVLTAISLISLIFFIGMMVFGRLAGINNPIQKQRTRSLMRSFMWKPLPDPLVDMQEQTHGSRRLERHFEIRDVKGKVIRIQVDCYVGSVLLASRNKIVHTDHFLVDPSVPYSNFFKDE